MANNDQGACFIVIGIIIMVMSIVIWFNFFIFIMGVGFIMGGICMSQQNIKKTGYSSPTPSYQPQPEFQQSAQIQNETKPINEFRPPKNIIPEVHKFCPHCGSPAEENICQICGSKID